MDRDTEVLKIQILADYYHSKFTSIASFSFGLTIAWLISFLTLLFQNVIDIAFYFFGIIVGFIVLGVFLYSIFREYHENLNKIDKLIQQVNKGEPLPSLRELRKKR